MKKASAMLHKLVLTIQAVQQAKGDWYSVINLANDFFFISILKESQTSSHSCEMDSCKPLLCFHNII